MMNQDMNTSKNVHRMRNRIAVGVLGAALGGLFPAAAFASVPTQATTVPSTIQSPSPASHPRCTLTNLPAAKVYVAGLLTGRVVRIERLNVQVSSARNLTPSDKSELESNLSHDLVGMQSLQKQVPDDTTCAQLIANAETMVFGYRVYIVMTPQAELVVSADGETAAATTIAKLEPGIQSAITYAANHGKDVTKAQQALDDLKTQISDAQGTLQGVSAVVLAQTPAGAPANHAIFVTARDKCGTALGDLSRARSDLQTILNEA
jgi:hypothetical protein